MTELAQKKNHWTDGDRTRLHELIHDPVFKRAVEIVMLQNSPSPVTTATFTGRPAQDILTLSSASYFSYSGLQTFRDALLTLASAPPPKSNVDQEPAFMSHVTGNDVHGEAPYTVNP